MSRDLDGDDGGPEFTGLDSIEKLLLWLRRLQRPIVPLSYASDGKFSQLKKLFWVDKGRLGRLHRTILAGHEIAESKRNENVEETFTSNL